MKQGREIREWGLPGSGGGGSRHGSKQVNDVGIDFVAEEGHGPGGAQRASGDILGKETEGWAKEHDGLTQGRGNGTGSDIFPLPAIKERG